MRSAVSIDRTVLRELLKVHPQSRRSDAELKKLAGRLLRCNSSIGDVPVIISELLEQDCTVREGHVSMGRLLNRKGGTINVFVDRPVQLGQAVTVLLSSEAYTAEAVQCVEVRKKYVVELVLIQHRD